MSELKAGWVDQWREQLATAKTEEERSAVTGLKPRRCWRGNFDLDFKSRARGAKRGGNKRPLPPLFAEDVKDK